jgi:hypothetical protein
MPLHPDASRLALDRARVDADTNFATTPVDATTAQCPLEKSLKGEVIEVEWGSGIKVSIAPPYVAPARKPPQAPVIVPNWKAGTAVEDGAGSRRPAVYLVKGKGSNAVTVKVRITENKNVSGASTLVGNFAGLLIEGTCPTAVGEHVVNGKIKNLPDSIQWYQGDASWGLDVPSLGSSVSLANSSRLEVFVVLDTPSSFYTPPGVWAEVLRFLCQKVGVAGLKTAAEVNARVTTYCHADHGLKYDTVEGAAKYGVDNEGGEFKLARYMNAASTVVNCYDQAAAVQSLCGAVGVNTTWLYLSPFGFIKPTNLVGIGLCNNPFFESNGSKPLVAADDPLRTRFGNHSFCECAGGILDACAGPHTGSKDRSQYCTASIDSERGRPGNANLIKNKSGVSRLS